MNTLKKDWRHDLGIGHVLQVRRGTQQGGRVGRPARRAPLDRRATSTSALQVVRCLLINPFPESALNEEAGKLFMEDYEQYFKKAQMMTDVHAASAKGEASGAGAEGEAAGADGEQSEKRQKAVDSSKAAEKRRQEKKKSLKR